MNSFISIFNAVLKRFAVLVAGFIIAFLLAELALQLLPVKTGFGRIYDPDMPINFWKPNTPYTSSSTWALFNVQTGSTNNKGFVSPFDYTPNEKAWFVVGDSHIEAQMNPYNGTMQGVLGENLKVPVYGLGLSGYSLADYLAVAAYATKEFQPQKFVFLITNGDITDSYTPYQSGSWYFKTTDQGLDHKRKPIDQNIRGLRSLMKKSATMRYLWLNLQINVHLAKIFKFNANLSDSPKQAQDPYRAVDFFIESLSTEVNLPMKDIVFVMDANRKSIYDTQTITEFPDRAKYFISRAKEKGMTVVDLNPVFAEHYDKNRLSFDHLPYDYHWNALAHTVAAMAVLEKHWK